MKHESAKIMKVVDELGTHFLHASRAHSFKADISRGLESFSVSIVVEGLALTDQEYASLLSKLSCRRSPELEDYYWQLAAETDSANELNLVSMMCDSVSAEYHN